MGGTRDGEVYELLSEKHRLELEERTNQKLVPLSFDEAELAKQIEDKTKTAELFKKKAKDDEDLTNEMREWLNRKLK